MPAAKTMITAGNAHTVSTKACPLFAFTRRRPIHEISEVFSFDIPIDGGALMLTDFFAAQGVGDVSELNVQVVLKQSDKADRGDGNQSNENDVFDQSLPALIL